MVTEGSLPFSQQPATYSYPEPEKYNPRPKILKSHILNHLPYACNYKNACAVGNFEVI